MVVNELVLLDGGCVECGVRVNGDAHRGELGLDQLLGGLGHGVRLDEHEGLQQQ